MTFEQADAQAMQLAIHGAQGGEARAHHAATDDENVEVGSHLYERLIATHEASDCRS